MMLLADIVLQVSVHLLLKRRIGLGTAILFGQLVQCLGQRLGPSLERSVRLGIRHGRVPDRRFGEQAIDVDHQAADPLGQVLVLPLDPVRIEQHVVPRLLEARAKLPSRAQRRGKRHRECPAMPVVVSGLRSLGPHRVLAEVGQQRQPLADVLADPQPRLDVAFVARVVRVDLRRCVRVRIPVRDVGKPVRERLVLASLHASAVRRRLQDEGQGGVSPLGSAGDLVLLVRLGRRRIDRRLRLRVVSRLSRLPPPTRWDIRAPLRSLASRTPGSPGPTAGRGRRRILDDPGLLSARSGSRPSPGLLRRGTRRTPRQSTSRKPRVALNRSRLTGDLPWRSPWLEALGRSLRITGRQEDHPADQGGAAQTERGVLPRGRRSRKSVVGFRGWRWHCALPFLVVGWPFGSVGPGFGSVLGCVLDACGFCSGSSRPTSSPGLGWGPIAVAGWRRR